MAYFKVSWRGKYVPGFKTNIFFFKSSIPLVPINVEKSNKLTLSFAYNQNLLHFGPKFPRHFLASNVIPVYKFRHNRRPKLGRC